MVKFISNKSHLRGENMEIKYEQCTKNDSPTDLDTYKVNDLGFLELIHCCNIEKEKEAKNVKRF